MTDPTPEEQALFRTLQVGMEAQSLASHLRLVHETFKEAGFVESQAFELTKLVLAMQKLH